MADLLTAAELLAVLSQRGFAVRPALGRVGVSPASILTDEDRVAIRENRAGLLAILAPATEPWDRHRADRLVLDADGLVERLGVDGRHPEIQDAAAMVTSATATRDMETVRFACAEFTATVKRIANRRA